MSDKKSVCPQDILVKQLAQMLNVTQDVASYIYETFTVVCINLLKDYNVVKVLPFVYLERKTTKPKNMYNVNTGEYVTTVPKEKLSARVTNAYTNIEKTEQYVQRYEERLLRQQLYKQQLEQEREEQRKEYEEYKQKQRRNARRRSKYRKQKVKLRQQAIERMIEDEARFALDEKEKYKRDLQRRIKG